MDEVVENLRACLLSSKGGISLNRITKDYHDVVGERIPFRRFNFETLEEFLGVVPGVRKVLRGGEYYIEAIPSQRTSHLAELVRKQKTDKKARKVSSFKRPVRSPYSSNTGYSNNYQRNQTSSRPQSMNTGFSSFSTNSRMGKVPTKNSPSPTSRNTTFKYPPAANADYVPLKDPPAKSQVSPRKIRPLMDVPRVSPSKLMMDKDSRNGASAIQETVKPKSSLQSRLLINVQPKRNETVNSNGTHLREEPKPVLRVSFPTTMNQQKEEPRKPQSVDVASMVPFETFIVKTPQEELKRLAISLKLTPPVYSVYTPPAKRSSIYAQVTVGDGKYCSYPEDAKTEFAAQSIVAKIALEDLKNKYVTAPPSITTDERLMKERILKIIDSHSSGVFSSCLPELYRNEFKELLPENWMRIVKECQEINVEKGGRNTSILTRQCHTAQEKAAILAPTSPFDKMRLAPLVRHSPGVLKKPDEPYWITHVTVVYSSDEIWVQLVGEEYSDIFDKMTKSMKEFYTKNFESTKAKNIEVDAHYAICVGKDWYRVKCLELDPENRQATVFFIDHGDDEICSDSLLHDLDKQFCSLAAQALKLSLHGLEEFADCREADLIVEKCLLERTLYIQLMDKQKLDSGEEILSVNFFDTNGPTDIDLNKLMSVEIIKTCMTKPLLKTEGRINEVYISHISQTGEVYLQLKNNNMKYLVNLMNKLIEQKLSQDLSSIAVTKVNLLKVYVIKSPEDGNWYRAHVKNVNYTTNEVDAFLIDFGKTVTVKLGSSVIDLENLSEVLPIFPQQAQQVRLHNIPPSSFDQEKIARLTKLAPPDQSLLLNVVQRTDNESLPVVELFKRQPPANEIVSINNTLVFDSKLPKPTNGDNNNNVKNRKRSERLTSRYGSTSDKGDPYQRKSLRTPEIPEINKFFDVHVTLVSNPGNFVIQPLNHQSDLKSMQEELQEECKKYQGAHLPFEDVKEGNLYAAQHPDGNWYRVCVLNKFMEQMVTAYLCDYGDLTLINLKKLQPLSDQFFELPYQALRAKLAGIRPVNVDWSVEDCLRFKELIEEKDMVSVVKAFVSNQAEFSNQILSLNLIDVSSDEDVYIDEVLIKEGRAQRTS